MDDNIYSITLADGTVLDNLRLNGNNFISSAPVDPAIFDGNCSPVTISGPEVPYISTGVHAHMQLVQVTQPFPGRWWICLRDLTEAELKENRNEAQMTYTAMMTDTLLEV